MPPQPGSRFMSLAPVLDLSAKAIQSRYYLEVSLII